MATYDRYQLALFHEFKEYTHKLLQMLPLTPARLHSNVRKQIIQLKRNVQHIYHRVSKAKLFPVRSEERTLIVQSYITEV